MTIDTLTKTNIATVTHFLNGTHAGNLSVIDDTVHQTIVTHGFPGGSPASREQYKQWFVTFGSSFSNMTFEIQSLVADRTTVAVRWRVDVDHTGPFAGVDPTGRRVSFTGTAFYRMQDGRIAETWLHVDERGLLAQLAACDLAA